MENIKAIYFSPTGTTRKVVEAIAQNISCKNVEFIDITKKDIREDKATVFNGELAIIGVPVYAGRVPVLATEYIRRLKGNNTPAVIVVVYGGRAYDAALFELKIESRRAGFVPFAAGAFVGEHSFASRDLIIENGRPDLEDLKVCKKFGITIKEKLDTGTFGGDLDLPGKTILTDVEPILPGAAPHTDPNKCVHCGICIEACPTGAIDQHNPIFTDKSLCIKCNACVKICPYGAKSMDLKIAKKIAETVLKSGRKKPEVFFAE